MVLFFLQGFILYRSEVNGRVEAVQTSKNNIYGKKAIVVASGAWTCSFPEPNSTYIPVKQRMVRAIFNFI
jgi:glycine/D-amino acid oxidase-like deaminating enzyme